MAKFTIDMPHVGESVTEAVIGKWLVSPGDTIRRYDPLVEVVTDKVNMEVPAPRDGTIVGLLVSEGDTVEMGAAIAEMEVEGAEPEQIPVADPVSDGPSVQAASRVGSMIVGANVGPTGGEFTDTSLQTESAVVEATESRASSAESRSGRRGRADTGARISPVVRRLAERHGIDVSQLTGSGNGGRVTKRDVEAYLEAMEVGTAPTTERADEVVEPSPIRRMIAENMSRSFREIPHAWGAIEVDVSGMVVHIGMRIWSGCRRAQVSGLRICRSCYITSRGR